MAGHERRLRHLPFFEALAGAAEGSEEWAGMMAGLVVLRLVDVWAEAGPALAEQELPGVSAIRDTIAAMPATDPARAVLDGVVSALERSSGGDLSLVAPRLFAYGRSLDFGGHWRVAIDVYRTLLDYAHPLMDADVATVASLRIGYCSRVLGEWDDARAAYDRAAEIAMASGDEADVLRSRVGRANLAKDRGNIPEAESMLDEVLERTTSAALADVRRLALHDRSTVAYLRGDAELAIRMAHEAMALTAPGAARDRLLADIGTYFAALGVRSAARDAHLIVAHTAQEQYSRWSSTLSLMELAALDGVESAFAEHRRILAAAPLPPELEALLHLYVARGERRFGRIRAALDSAERAREIAEESGQHQRAFEAEELVVALRAAVRHSDRQSVAAGASEVPTPDSLRGIASELASMRALAQVA